MNQPTENIFFTRGLSQVPPIKRESFYKEVRNILGVSSNASLSRRANGIFGTSLKQQIRLERLFFKHGITNWRGKARKRRSLKTA
jgi:hypothetical protein